MYQLIYAHAQLCRHPLYIYIRIEVIGKWYTCYIFKSCRTKKLQRHPSLSSVPSYSPGNQFLKNSLGNSAPCFAECHGHVILRSHNMYKISFYVSIPFKEYFSPEKKGILQCLRRDVIGSCISKFGPRFQNPFDCGHFNYRHRVLVSFSVNALFTVGHGVSIARRVSLLSLFVFSMLIYCMVYSFFFFTAEIALNDG